MWQNTAQNINLASLNFGPTTGEYYREFKMKKYADKIAAQKEQVRIAEEKSKRDDVYRENQSQRDAVAQERQSQRNYNLDKIRVSAYRDVAVEYAKNQPKTVTYNNIYWK